MARPCRYYPGVVTLEVMTRTLEAARLLRPSEALNDVVLGVFGHVLERHADTVRLHELGSLSTHYHSGLTATCRAAAAAFMRDLNSALAKKVGLECDWNAKVWGQRYSGTVLYESAQPERQIYIAEQGLPENLFASPEDNPCVNSISAKARGVFELEGTWYDKTAMSKAGVAWHSERRAEFGRRVTVPLHPWPFEARWTKAKRQREAKALIERSVKHHRARREAEGAGLYGADRMRQADPRSRTKAPQTGTSAPQVRGTPEEIAEYQANYAKGMEARQLALEAAAEALDLKGWGDDFAVPGPLEAARRRAAEQRAKVAANLAKAGHPGDAGPPPLTIPTFAELEARAAARKAVKTYTRTRRMKRRQHATGARVRLRARRRRPLASGPTRRRRGLRLLPRLVASRVRATGVVEVPRSLHARPRVVIVLRPRRLSRPAVPDPGG